MKINSRGNGAARPDWTYSVPPPKILSPIWMLEILASLSIPIAGIGVIAGAVALGWVNLN